MRVLSVLAHACRILMGSARLWLRASGTMAMVMLVGWGLMKTTSPSAENLMQVREMHIAYLWVQSQVRKLERTRTFTVTETPREV